MDGVEAVMLLNPSYDLSSCLCGRIKRRRKRSTNLECQIFHRDGREAALMDVA